MVAKDNLDTSLIEQLASIHCTNEEIAAVMGCTRQTLDKHYREIIQTGKEKGRASLRRMQYEKAKQGNVGMLIWLGKQLLGQSEKIEQINYDPNDIVQIRFGLSTPEKALPPSDQQQIGAGDETGV